MELTGERDALVQLVRALALARRLLDARDQCRGAAERAQRQALGLVQLERLAAVVGEDHSEPAAARGDRNAGDGPGVDDPAEALRNSRRSP